MAEEWLFGRYRLVPAHRRLHAGERSMELDARALAVLECLLRHADRVVPRASLIAEAWPEADVVFDSAVSKVMRRLRVALGDSHGTVLQTIYGEGYRLALPATLLPPRPGTAAMMHAPVGARNGAVREPAREAATAAQRSRPTPDVSAKQHPPTRRPGTWRIWLPWTIAALATLLSACLAWLLLAQAGPR